PIGRVRVPAPWALSEGTAGSPTAVLPQHRQADAALVRDGLLALERAALGLLLLPEVDLFEQGVHHLALGDLADDLAPFEDDALAVAGGDAEVGLAGLAGAVDHAAEHAHLDRRLAAGQALLQVGDDLLQVDGQPAAGRAGDQLRLAHAPLRRLQDV